MSSEAAIRLHSVSKEYRIFRRPEDRLKQAMFWGRRSYFQPVLAVNRVTVEIRRGETFGIVGCNGSGKSTLLQMICGTTAPTHGGVEVYGRVAGLLELGAGFNPEFTGRENVWVSAAVQGLGDDQIEERFDEIVRFAAIGSFIDQPVRSYSSGMFARLAFAVAIHVDADILVVDEALSVGDEAFQRKCFSKIEAFKDAGGTVLFVSHAAATVLELCDRAMLLDRGDPLLIGSPKSVIEAYHRLIYAAPEARERVRDEIVSRGDSSDEARTPERSTAGPGLIPPPERQETPLAALETDLVPSSTFTYASRGCRIVDPHVREPRGGRVNVLAPGQIYEYRYDVVFDHDCSGVRCGMLLKLVNGSEICGLTSHPPGQGIPSIRAGTHLSVSFRFRTALAPGSYFLNAGVVGTISDDEVYLHRIIDAAMFRVIPVGQQRLTSHVDLSVEPLATIDVVSDNHEGGSRQ